MNLTMLNAASVMSQCARFTALLGLVLRALGSILQTSSYQQLWISKVQNFNLRSRHSHVIHMLDMATTLLARALQGLTPRLKGASRWVAKVLVGVLCLGVAQPAEAQLDAKQSLKRLANYQLTDKQYKCHNEIVYRESRWNIDAIGNKSGKKQTHGYYQLKIEAIKGKPYDYQFSIYWYYVASRYGFDKHYPEIPDYCNALKHLKTRGWQ